MRQGCSTSRYRLRLAGVALGLVGVIAGRWVIAQLIFGLVLWVSVAATTEQLRADRRRRLGVAVAAAATPAHEHWAELARWLGYACIGWFAFVSTPWTLGPWWVHAPLTIVALTVLYAAVDAFFSHRARWLSSSTQSEEARVSESA